MHGLLPSPVWLTLLCAPAAAAARLSGLIDLPGAADSSAQACAGLTLGTTTAQPPEATALQRTGSAKPCPAAGSALEAAGISAPHSRSCPPHRSQVWGRVLGDSMQKHLQRALRENFNVAERVLSTPASLRFQVEHLLVAPCKVGIAVGNGAPRSAGTAGSKLSLVPVLLQTLAKGGHRGMKPTLVFETYPKL